MPLLRQVERDHNRLKTVDTRRVWLRSNTAKAIYCPRRCSATAYSFPTTLFLRRMKLQGIRRLRRTAGCSQTAQPATAVNPRLLSDCDCHRRLSSSGLNAGLMSGAMVNIANQPVEGVHFGRIRQFAMHAQTIRIKQILILCRCIARRVRRHRID